jgi:hypothetical protein
MRGSISGDKSEYRNPKSEGNPNIEEAVLDFFL